MYITLKSLWERHKNKSIIAKLTGNDWKTVAKRIKEIEGGKEFPTKKPYPRILDPYQERIIKWLEDNLSGVRIHEKIQEEGGKVGMLYGKRLYFQNQKKRQYLYPYTCSPRRGSPS